MVRWPLLCWMLRQSWLMTLLGLGIAVPYVLFTREILHWWSEWPMLFIFLHSMVLAVTFGRSGSGPFGFLYTRGYSRDALWGHAMVATLTSVLLVWGPAALAIWTGLRSDLQDRLQSPYFPVMAPREYLSPAAWLIGYVLLISAFQYGWIRKAQPTRGPHAGFLLAIAAMAAGLTVVENLRGREPLLGWGSALLASVGVVTMFIAGWRLHRRLEVQA